MDALSYKKGDAVIYTEYNGTQWNAKVLSPMSAPGGKLEAPLKIEFVGNIPPNRYPTMEITDTDSVKKQQGGRRRRKTRKSRRRHGRKTRRVR